MINKMIQIGELPACFFVVKSGWKDKYHLIYEDPQNGDYDFTCYFLTKEQIKDNFPFAYKEVIK